MEEMTLESARALSQAACLRAKDDPEAVFLPEVLQSLALVKGHDGGVWTLCKKLLRAAGVTLRDLGVKLPKVRLAEVDRDALPRPETMAAGEEARFAGEMLDECPMPNLFIPQPYTLLPSGVVKTDVDQEGASVEHKIAFAPVLISGRLRDAVSGEESLLVNWRWEGAPWNARVVKRSGLFVGRQLAELTNVGFPVADDTVRAMVPYLHRLEAYNRRQLPCAAVSSQLGWQGEDGENGFLVGATLVQPDGEIVPATRLELEKPELWTPNRVQFHGLSEGDEQIVSAFHSRGTLAEWLKIVALCAPFPKVMAAFYAGFVPPLLQMFRCPNFILDYGHSTSTGKTTTVRVPASIYGNPDEHAPDGIIHKWNATGVFAERAPATMNYLPFILDDSKTVKGDPRMIAKVLYLVTGGKGRGRGSVSGLARTLTWHTVLFSTGEQPITSFTEDGGTRTRTLEIRGVPFGKTDLATAAIVAALNAGLMANYGHAGPLFLSWVMRERDRWDEWRAFYRGLVEGYSQSPPSAEAGRLAQYAAAITAAGQMAHRALELPFDFTDPIAVLWNELASEAAEAAGEVRALSHVVSWANQHEANFYGRMRHDSAGGELAPSSGAYGRWDGDVDWAFLAVFPNVLQRALKDAGFDYDGIVTGWKDRGWLDCEPKRCVKMTRSGAGQTRMVRILRSAVEEHG